MTIHREIDNDECREALRAFQATGRVSIGEVLLGKYPIETGALLWHGLIEAKGDVFSITTDGRDALAEWDGRAALAEWDARRKV